MYFDPVSSWLVVLIADGIMLANEKGNSGALAEYRRRSIEDYNSYLNGDIRRIKGIYRLTLAEEAYKQIQISIRVTQKNLSFHNAANYIVIDLDNQEYIIAIFEECAKKYRKYYDQWHRDEYLQKAEWYENAAIEAKKRKEIYIERLKEARIVEAKERKKQENISLAFGMIFLAIIIVLFLLYCMQ